MSLVNFPQLEPVLSWQLKVVDLFVNIINRVQII